MKKATTLAALAVAVLFAFSLASCQKQDTSALGRIKKAGKIIVGTNAGYPPYEFHKNVDGKDQIVGFDVEIGKEIAKDLGVQLEIKDMAFDGLLAALNAGTIDFVLAGMTPTDERKKSTDFSAVYYTAVQSVIVLAADKDKIKDFAYFEGKGVGAQKGTIQVDLAKKYMPKAKELKELGKITDLVLELRSKRVAGIIVEKPVADAYASKNPDLAVSAITFPAEEESGSAAAVKQGNKDLVDAINKTLDRLTAAKAVEVYVAAANDMIE